MNVEIDFTAELSNELFLIIIEIFKVCTDPENNPGFDESAQFINFDPEDIFAQSSQMLPQTILAMKFKTLNYEFAVFYSCFVQIRRGENEFLILLDFDCDNSEPAINLAVIDMWRRSVADRIRVKSSIQLDC